MDICIRKCRLDDYSAITVLNTNEMNYEYPAEKTRDKLMQLLSDNNHAVFVAAVDEKVVGYVHANNYELLYAPHMKNIMGIAVSSAFRKNGIGKMLLDEVEKWALETGASGVRLVSGAKRQGSHAFYAACGYTCSKEQMNFKKMF